MVSTSSRAVTIGQWFVFLVVVVILVNVWRVSTAHREQVEIISLDVVSNMAEEAVPVIADVVSESPVVTAEEKTPTTGRTADGTFFVEHGATLKLNKESLPENESLIIEFRLDVPWVNDVNQRPLLMSPGNKLIRLEGRPHEKDKQRIRVEIPAGRLTTGRHVLQLKTNERNHMPVRRYGLEVKVLD